VIKFRHIGSYGTSLPLQKVCYGVAKFLIRHPVCRPSRGREEPATNFMFSLRAGLEATQTRLYAKFDALVIASLEMKSRHLLRTPPVTTVQSIAADEKKCRPDNTALTLGEDQKDLLTHGSSDPFEKFEGQSRVVSVSRESRPIELENGTPDVGLHAVAPDSSKLNRSLPHLPAFSLHFLTPLGSKTRQKILE